MEEDAVEVNDPNEKPKEPIPEDELPSLMSRSDYCRFQNNQLDAENTCTSLKSLVGLSIPLIWMKDEEDDNKHYQLRHACKSIGVTNISQPDTTLVNITKSGVSGDSNVKEKTNIEVHEKDKWKGHCLVPWSTSDTWNEMEVASFTLGLYIFGKDFENVNKFIGNKTMRDIQDLYYGRFYKSDKYRRWNECKKKRSRRCNYGSKIFKGPRRHELFSRLLRNVPNQCGIKLLKESKKFVETRAVTAPILQGYLSSLKASVGLNALVEAVGIGTEKDITGLPADSDSVKSTSALPLHPEVPTGKDLARLTHAEIIHFLTAGFRLTKSQSSDLFWDAVWPRLLARGWHSEQLGSNNYNIIENKHRLLFFVPGVKEFSKQLVKGNHYFEHISDVLSKVASEHELIELERVENNGCTSKEGNVSLQETSIDDEDYPFQQRRDYLQPPTPKLSTLEKEFTVVDTSLGCERVRELRRLPEGGMKASTFEEGSDKLDASKEQTNKSEFVDAMCLDKGKTNGANACIDKGVSSDIDGIQNKPSKQVLPIISIGSTNPSAASKEKQKRDVTKLQSNQTVVCNGKSVVDPPVTKIPIRAERNLNSASVFMVPGARQEVASSCANISKPTEKVAVNNHVAPSVNQEKASYSLLNKKLSENAVLHETAPKEKKLPAGLQPQEYKTLADSPSITSSFISREVVLATSSFGTKIQHEKPRPMPLIDLNLPVLPGDKDDEPLVSEVAQRQQNKAGKESDYRIPETISKTVSDYPHQPGMNTQRRSTRTSQPTTRLLESFALDNLKIRDKRKSRDYLHDKLTSRPSRCMRPKVANETSGGSGGLNFQNVETENVGGSRNRKSNGN